MIAAVSKLHVHRSELVGSTKAYKIHPSREKILRAHDKSGRKGQGNSCEGLAQALATARGMLRTEHLHFCKLVLKAGWYFSVCGVSATVRRKPNTRLQPAAGPGTHMNMMPSEAANTTTFCYLTKHKFG